MNDHRHPLRTESESDAKVSIDSDQEELLKRGLVRVSIAADGMDPLLDKRLKELRNALRSDAPKHLLGELMPDLERAVLAADRSRESRLEKTTQTLRALIRQLQQHNPPHDTANQLKRLSKQLDRQIEHAAEIPELIEQLVSLQAMVLNAPGTGQSSGGLWSRLFGTGSTEPQLHDNSSSASKSSLFDGTEDPVSATDKDDPDTLPPEQALQATTELGLAAQLIPEQDDTDQIVQDPVTQPEHSTSGVLAGEDQEYSKIAAHIETILLNLLSELQVLDTDQSRCEKLRERITGGLNWYELAAALDELGVLVLAAQHSRQADFERYLQQLNSRLAQFQGNLEEAHESYSGSVEAGKMLEGSIREQVQDLHGDVREATDLNSLKANVENKLDSLLQKVEQARQVREEREELISGQLKTMVHRIKIMEVEAQSFRSHLEEQRQRAMIDSLTGLANRAGLQKRMEEEFERWQRYGGQLLMVVLDVDHFKRINDRFGHLSGDKVLRLIAQQLSRRLRKSDFIGRFGGEEFVLLMPGTSLEQAGIVLEALRAGIEESPFHFKAEPVTVTISIGYTDFRSGDSLDQVFDRADRAMYQAKELGRNRLVQAD